MIILFINFYLDLHFQGHLLQELNYQTQCDHFGENFMKISSMVSEMSNFFLFFQVTYVPPWKLRLSCATTSIHAAHLFIDPKYLDHNRHKKSRISRTVCEKTHYKLYWSSFGILWLSIAIWEISSYMKILTFENSWSWKYRSRSWCTAKHLPWK